MAESPPPQHSQSRFHPSSELLLPLLSKRLNSVEKYVSDFSLKSEMEAYQPQKKKNPMGTRRFEEYKHHGSGQLSSKQPVQRTSNRSCIKYESIARQTSEDRLQSLSKLEKDYGILKDKIYHKKSPRAYASSGTHTPTAQIAEEDVRRELKASVINENGKKYFADLYLLKKGREEIMRSLQGAGKISLEQSSYQEKLKHSEHDFVKSKILEEREVKRTKMIKGRNLHWNVYYDMLALSEAEKKKLKGICKFTSTFGIA